MQTQVLYYENPVSSSHITRLFEITMPFLFSAEEALEPFATNCNGMWSTPPGCSFDDCTYRATWRYETETDSIKFVVRQKMSNPHWIGIGFSLDRTMVIYLSERPYFNLLVLRMTFLPKSIHIGKSNNKQQQNC